MINTPGLAPTEALKLVSIASVVATPVADTVTVLPHAPAEIADVVIAAVPEATVPDSGPADVLLLVRV